jgi:hypothetical protein
MKILIVAALFLAGSACGAYSFPGGTVAVKATVSGHVIAIPCAPVENPANPCTGRPVSGLEIVFTSAGGAAATTTTDSTGHYAVQLDAGTWKVAFKSYMRMVSGPQSIDLTAGANVVADYVVDSGIRVPAPAA